MALQLRIHLSFGDVFRIELYPNSHLSQHQELNLVYHHPVHGALLDIRVKFSRIIAYHRTQYIAHYTLVDRPSEGIYIALSYRNAPLTWRQTIHYQLAKYFGNAQAEDSWVLTRPGRNHRPAVPLILFHLCSLTRGSIPTTGNDHH